MPGGVRAGKEQDRNGGHGERKVGPTQIVDDNAVASDPAQLARYLMTVIWGLSVQVAGGATEAQLREVAEMVLRNWPTPPGHKARPPSRPRRA